jgi:hypothetical protein
MENMLNESKNKIEKLKQLQMPSMVKKLLVLKLKKKID